MKISKKAAKKIRSLLVLVKDYYTMPYGINWYRSQMPEKLSYRSLWRLFNIAEQVGCLETSSKRIFDKDTGQFATVWNCKYKSDLPEKYFTKASTKARIKKIQKLIENGVKTPTELMEQSGLPKATVYRYWEKMQAMDIALPEKRTYNTEPFTEEQKQSYKSPLTPELREFFINYDEALGIKDAAQKRASLPEHVRYEEEVNEFIMLKSWMRNPGLFNPPAGLAVPTWMSKLLRLEIKEPELAGFKLFGGYALGIAPESDF